MTLDLLHHEYLEQHPNDLRYSAFCDRYREFRERRRLSMRQHHVAGDKMFVDYSGKKPCLVSSSTGEVTEVELFVAVLDASNYTYAEATHTQQVPDFIGSHMRALAFYGGVPRITVPDNLKSGVTKVCRYEPTLQRSYEDFANHYGTAVIPARPYKPRDKAKVEVAVQIAQRWILGRLRNRVYHSLSALNAAIRDSMVGLNTRVMRNYNASRREMYERFDGPALLALPADRFDVTEWKLVTVNIDAHVAFDERTAVHPGAATPCCSREPRALQRREACVRIYLILDLPPPSRPPGAKKQKNAGTGANGHPGVADGPPTKRHTGPADSAGQPRGEVNRCLGAHRLVIMSE